MRWMPVCCLLISLMTLVGCRQARHATSDIPQAKLLPLPAVTYPWTSQHDEANALANRIPTPPGFTRAPVQAGSFAEWLRFLPLKPGQPPVHLFNGKLKGNQQAHVAVIRMDVGTRDLQQCADAVMRLRAEYLYSRHRYDAIQFSFTNGTPARFARWADGYRPRIHGNHVEWIRAVQPDSSYTAFRAYLATLFTYAGTASLSRDLSPVPVEKMQIGDVFIQGGFPGHAVIVVDMAVEPKSGRKIFLLAQSYMPAQEMHVLRNPEDPQLSPWYDLAFGDILSTPEWTFPRETLKRFPN